MYDTVNFILPLSESQNTDFLNETPQYFDIVTGQTDYANDNTVVFGFLGNYSVSASKQAVQIKNGSLCKYQLGNGFQTLTRQETQHAVEKLSDTLHLPIDKATVTRLDIAGTFILQNPVQVYYNHLGEWKNSKENCKRCPITNGAGDIEGINYFKRLGLLCFYNKLKEQKDKEQPIPELYQNRNVLRYERRYSKNLSKCFNVEQLTAEMLYSEEFYIKAGNMWRDDYFSIKKINDITLNFSSMKGKKDLYNLGVLALVQQAGGELAVLEQIKEAQKSNQLSKKAAFDIRQAVVEATKNKADITATNEAIKELDKKIDEAVKYYR